MALLPLKGVKQRERQNRIFNFCSHLNFICYALHRKKNLTDAQIKEALVNDKEIFCPLEELIATGEAAFEFIRQSEMDIDIKNAFYQLEKQFMFYRNLLVK